MFDQLKTRQVPIHASDYSALMQEFTARKQSITEKRGKTFLGDNLSGLRFEIIHPSNDSEVFKLTGHLNPRTYTFGHNYLNVNPVELSDFLKAVQEVLPVDISIEDLSFTSLEYGALILQPRSFLWPQMRYYKDAPPRPMFPAKNRVNTQYGVSFKKGDYTLKAYDKKLQYEIERGKEIPAIENFEKKWNKVSTSFHFKGFKLADINAPNVLQRLSNDLLQTYDLMAFELDSFDLRNEPPKVKEYVAAYLRFGEDYLKDLGKDKKAEVRKHLKRLSKSSVNSAENRIKIEEALKPYSSTYSK